MTLLSVAALFSLVLVGLVRWDALRRGVLDTPNARSSHVRPTPRGGGLGLIAAIGLAALWEGAHTGIDAAGGAAVLAVSLVALIGWLDDHRGAPVRWRLILHLAAGVLVLPAALRLELPLPSAVAMVWWVFWMVSSINVVNFMDGIDGIIGLQAVVYGLFVFALGESGGMASAVGGIVAGAGVGFLAWNWQPARIFMGDVGSGSLGAIFVLLGILLLREGRIGFVASFAPLAPIFLDAAVTLVARARRGARLSEAHREHLYQRLANGGWGHARVALLYGVSSAIAACAAAIAPRGGLSLLLALLALFTVIGAVLARRSLPDAALLS